MSQPSPQSSSVPQPIKPFGTETKRSPLPLVLWTIVYLVWLGTLLWMLFYHTKPV